MSDLPTFSVVIVNYNGGDFLANALASLKRQTFTDFEVLLVDNASADGSVDDIDATGLPGFQLLKQEANLGFAAGNNVAAKVAKGRWLLLLNPDTEAKEDWVEQLNDAAERYPTCRTFASAQINLSNRELMDGAGDCYQLFGIPWRGGFERSVKEMPDEGLCFAACGASAMYDRELFLSLNGFDERLFCYCEDVDLGFRLQKLGEECIFVPSAVIYHEGSGISGQESEFSTTYGSRNRSAIFVKNMPFWLLFLTFPAHLAIIAYIVVRNRRSPRAKWIWDSSLKGLPMGWKMRFSPEWRVASSLALAPGLLKSFAWNPFRMSKRRTHIRSLPSDRLTNAEELTEQFAE